VSVGLTHRFKTNVLSLTYSRTETVLVGQVGRVEADSVVGGLTLTPLRSLQVNLGAAVSNVASKHAPDTTVYRANAAVSYRLTKWLSASLSYRFSVQDRAGVEIYHNVLSIGLDASYSIRAD